MDNKNLKTLRDFFEGWVSSGFKRRFHELKDYHAKHGTMPRILMERWGCRSNGGLLSSVVIDIDRHGSAFEFLLDDSGVTVNSIGDDGRLVCFWRHGEAGAKDTPKRVGDQIEDNGFEVAVIAEALVLFRDAYAKFINDFADAFEEAQREERASRRARVEKVLGVIGTSGQYLRDFLWNAHRSFELCPERAGELEEMGIFNDSIRFLDTIVTVKAPRCYHMWPDSFFRLDATRSGRIVLHQLKAQGDERHHFTVFDIKLADIELDPANAVEKICKAMEHSQFDFDDCLDALDTLGAKLVGLIMRVNVLRGWES